MALSLLADQAAAWAADCAERSPQLVPIMPRVCEGRSPLGGGKLAPTGRAAGAPGGPSDALMVKKAPLLVGMNNPSSGRHPQADRLY